MKLTGVCKESLGCNHCYTFADSDAGNKYCNSLEGLSQQAFELPRSIQFIPLG